MAVREYVGGAKQTTLASSITNTATSFTVAAGGGTGYPTGAGGNFVVCLDIGLAAEEKILCSARSTDTFTVATGGRGYDDTAASAHTTAATVNHVLTATDLREANAHVNATAGAHPATAISFTPAAGIAATTVQAAVEELKTDSDAAYQAVNTAVIKADVKTAETFATETTTSTSYTNLTTTGPAVTVTVPASGRVLVMLSVKAWNSIANEGNYMAHAMSGANTSSGSDAFLRASGPSTTDAGMTSSIYEVGGLTPGSTTFTAKYRVGGGTGSFAARRIVVIPL